MNTRQNAKALRLTRYAAGFLASGAMLTAGCANMATTASAVNPTASASGTMSGVVHGGNQVVTGATVNLYYVGQSGVGVGSTSSASGAQTSATSGQLLATTTTDNGGSFQFNQVATPTTGTVYPTAVSAANYMCGNQADPQLYLIVRGGNTTGNPANTSQNSAAVFISPIGLCSQSAHANVVVSEITTAATAAALGQYINPTTELIGYDGIGVGYTSANMAFATVANLVNPNTGLAVTSKTLTNGTSSAAATTNVAGVSVTATPNSAKLNTVGNILSSCVNQTTSSSGTSCTTLFNNAVPPALAHSTFKGTSTTLPAATDTLMAAVYMFTNVSDTTTANRTNVYGLGAATGAPYQPTISAVPTDWSIGVTYATNNACGTGAAGSNFLSNPFGLAIDGNGNVWISNAQSANSALVALTPTGAPLACKTMGTTLASGGRSTTAIDDIGNIWYGDTGASTITRFNPQTAATLTYTTLAPPLSITADGSDNVFFSGSVGSAGHLYKILSGATAATTNSPIDISNTLSATPYTIFPDAANDIWIASGSNFVTQAQQTTGGSAYLAGYNSVQFSVPSPAVGLSVGPANNVYVVSGDPSASETVLTTSGASYAVKAGFPTNTNAGGISNARSLYLDGAQNVWIANGTANTSNQQYSLAEIGSDAVSISADGNVNGGFQKTAAYFNAPRSAIIDLNGNLWVTNDGNTNSVTEVIGAAVPVYQPYAKGLTNGRFQTIP